MDLSPERLQELGVDDPGVLPLLAWKGHGRVNELAAVAVDRDGSLEARFWAIRFLGSFHDDRAIDALIEALSDPDESLRIQAASALGKVGGKRALRALERAAFDTDGHVRITAVRALGDIGEVSAIPTVNKVAQSTSWGLLHEWATATLVKLNAPEAEGLLIAYLDGASAEADTPAIRRVGRKLKWVPRWAAKELGRLGTREAVEPLKRARRRDPLHRRTYTRAIKAIERRHPV